MHFADNLPSRSQIFEYWKCRLGKMGFLIDWGEPGCWACGHHYGTRYDIRHPHVGWNEILKCWDRIPLQRSHIIPRSLGGKNSVANLFLMCRECHDLAPNTKISAVFFDWARSQSCYRRTFSKIGAALESYGVDAATEQDFLEVIISHEFKAWMSGKAGLHWPQSRYASQMSRLTAATIVGLAVHYRRTHRKLSDR